MKYTVLFLPLILVLLQEAECLRCLSCNAMLNPLLCNRIEICDKSEVCMAVKFLTNNKEILYNVGCFPKNSCVNGTIGNPDQNNPNYVVHLDALDHVMCSYCCQTDSCNHGTCGNEGLSLSRGPICFNCPQTTNPSSCSFVKTCEPSEVCRLHERTQLGLHFFSTSCSTKSDCQIQNQNIFGRRRRRRRRTFQRTECCDSDLCNGKPLGTQIQPTTETITSTKTMTSTIITTRPPSQYRDCKDWKDLYNASTGMYDVYPDGRTRITVYCDQVTDGGGWTVITSRKGSFNGGRLWAEYIKGFGDINGNFWLGNENMHLLTKQGISDVYFKLQSIKGSWYHATYSNFSIGPEADGYRLHINVTSYKGNAGESLGQDAGYLARMKFTTSDKDNDRKSGNCAVSYSGGWWFNNCEYVCLTCAGSHYEWRYDVGNLQSSRMMIRRIY